MALKPWQFQALKVVGLVLLYYPFSIGLTFYQKWFIKSFRFPLTVVCCHYVIKFVLVWLLRLLLVHIGGRQRVSLSWYVSVTSIAPVGVAASLDIGLSNWAFEFITVSLYTMAKSTCIIFILLFALLFKLEKLVELAALCSGVRWVVSQFLMQKKELGLNNPIDMIYNVQPWMIVSCIPLVLIFEGDKLEQAFENAIDHSNGTRTLGLILLGGIIALCMELSEYLLLVQTSSLTVSVAGVFKELFTLVAAYFFNGDRFSLLNSTGLFVCLLGIGGHVWYKARKMHRQMEHEEEGEVVSVGQLDEGSKGRYRRLETDSLSDVSASEDSV